MTHLLTERTSHACKTLDILGPASAAGWLSVWSCLPGELPGGVAWLGLGSQAIPVRLVLNAPGVSEYLEQLARMAMTDLHLEQFIILEGFSPDLVIAFGRSLTHAQRRIHVGTYAQYRQWVATRLGPMGRLSGSSPVRRLLETFLTYSPLAGPSAPVPLVGNFDKSRIADSFRVGAEGVQAMTTLLRLGHGPAAVRNVEEDKAWQSLDVDLLVAGLAGAQHFKQVKVEVKNEDYRSGNISLETFSSFDHQTPGWLHYSAADVLISGAWPTGDFIVMDFQKVRDWILGGSHQVPLKHGTAKGQTYRSQFYCTPIRTLLAQFDDVFCLKLDAWLPKAYDGRFDSNTLVPQQYRDRQLPPIR